VLAALRAKNADEILNAANPSQGLFGKGNKFGPVVDGWALPGDPGRLWDQGKQAGVPFMTGTNADEGTVFLQQLPIKHVLGYRLTARAMFQDHADEVLKLFPVEKDEDIQASLNKLVTVAAFVSPARMLVRAMAKRQTPVYLYHFTRVPETTRGSKLGACHAIEIPYVFKTLPRGIAEKDEKLSDAICRYWANFAKTGNPNGAGLPAWPNYATDMDECLELGDEIKVKSGLYREACDTLEKIYREKNGDGHLGF
jgi:para-nitrobenzyl esterase